MLIDVTTRGTGGIAANPINNSLSGSRTYHRISYRKNKKLSSIRHRPVVSGVVEAFNIPDDLVDSDLTHNSFTLKGILNSFSPFEDTMYLHTTIFIHTINIITILQN